MTVFVFDPILNKAKPLVEGAGIDIDDSGATVVVSTSGSASLIYRRQGGNATDWNTQGTNNYTPSSGRIQAGSIVVPDSSGVGQSFVDIVFPVAYSAAPLVFACAKTPGDTTEERGTIVSCGTPSATGFTIHCQRYDDAEFTADSYVNWWAIGPE